jgi:hypothetical protein
VKEKTTLTRHARWVYSAAMARLVIQRDMELFVACDLGAVCKGQVDGAAATVLLVSQPRCIGTAGQSGRAVSTN